MFLQAQFSVFFMCCRYFSAVSQCLFSVFLASPYLPFLLCFPIAWGTSSHNLQQLWSPGLLARFLLLFLWTVNSPFSKVHEGGRPGGFYLYSSSVFGFSSQHFVLNISCLCGKGFLFLFCSLGAGHNSEQSLSPSHPSLCPNACFWNVNSKYLVKFKEDTFKELKSEFEV